MNKQAPYILVVDDEQDIRQLVSEILEDEGYDVAMAENATEAKALKNQRPPNLILLDIWMPDSDGITLLREWVSEDDALCPVVMMSGHASVESAVEATRLGAYDFLEKPLSLAKLLLIVERALETSSLQRENAGLKQQLMIGVDPVGKSAVVERTKDKLKRLAQHDARVLFVGEAGVGKEMFARYLHNNSSRRDGSFVDVSVGSISPENSAVEFFGREDNGRVYRGLLEQAHRGTLFLGEIGGMDPETQTRLLSALESSSFLRVGGSQAVRVDVRVVASTRMSLEEEVNSGRFRQDLYYLLNVVTLEIPPLREHSEDVPSLLNFYVDHFVTQEKLPFRRFSMAAQNYLRNYSWPGNVRELRNLVQRLMILGAGDDIELDEVKTALGSIAEQPKLGLNVPEFFNLPLKEARDHFEKSYLEYHFEKTGGSVAKLASAIGMERTHLYRKLHSLKIKL
ncbi:sigma-54-dependent Fis family transcriptional regulator [Methylomonas sp. EFPC1]|uniref:Sigma-54 dependent transcriptional regulator n=1 Tax=Methylomonas defluvii TaxID=3045149 RepID=A0ABU4UCP7_9GAMM|nr:MULTISPECIES: sigma-54 dependent transcriptional regulator [unclassified Methylomonas]MDX8127237.1 sigma-54 dependent transcriptional regulator [Methylomonas sp. OY6]NOV30823.1 sigma-54-dependent Fis family transcriptional regulator [Methylomonas sp. ZR1]PKD41605.1 sigma-54-dependent Fis family transcriptional regulator [Methylomonas sp. Kb3]QBC26501.1 sigma-54-dependent Fis family transcriptional regulator [Methylomonas sp. LW13]QSB02407.1 sigma-54-dependent Fis family transcriptional regu